MKWGVVLCSPDDLRVLKKMVCFNELSAIRRGRHWKRRDPDHVVRTFSLLPGDTSAGTEIPIVARRQRQ
jgi:hypothetical protein